MKSINFISFEELPSTNTYALQNINDLSDRTIILAASQTHGKGRFQRRWISDNSENLYFSIVLKFPKNNDGKKPFANLTQYMSLIICQTLELYGVKAQIKWPNDVLVEGKKISGILAESSLKNGELQGIVLGVGINLNLTAEEIAKIDQKATSLNLETGKNIDKELFLNSLLERFFERYDAFLSEGFTLIKEDYVKRSPFIGSEIAVSGADSDFNAIAEGILDDGSLCIKTGSELKSLHSGDIILI